MGINRIVPNEYFSSSPSLSSSSYPPSSFFLGCNSDWAEEFDDEGDSFQSDAETETVSVYLPHWGVRRMQWGVLFLALHNSVCICVHIRARACARVRTRNVANCNRRIANLTAFYF